MDLIERKANLSHRVTQELGRAIVCGDYGPADNFPTEAELCLKFGVSRTAVREAVKMLSAKGLVASKPRQGIRVMPEEDWNILDPDLLKWSLEVKPTRAVLKEFFQMRVAIEPEAAALAAQFARPEHKRSIAEALENMRTAPANSVESRDADVEFHVALLYATENRFYIRMRDFIRTALNVSIGFTTPDASLYDNTVEAHAKILRAIEDGDAGQASRDTRKLIDGALYYIEHGIDGKS
ncbi:MAG: FadR/GntR family transcriptional regulator [Woeseiaceae bacterium]